MQRVDLAYLDEARSTGRSTPGRPPRCWSRSGPKQLRPHQERALEDVREGLADHDRGKLIMACGTGKTFTSLQIAEDLVGAGGRCCSWCRRSSCCRQTLREWMAGGRGRRSARSRSARTSRSAEASTDDDDISTIDLTEPATTDAATLVSADGDRPARDTADDGGVLDLPVDRRRRRRRSSRGSATSTWSSATRRTAPPASPWPARTSRHFVRVHDNDYLRGRQAALHDRHAADLRRRRQAARPARPTPSSRDGRRGDSTARSSTGSGSARRSSATCSPTTRCWSSPSTRSTSPRTSSSSWPTQQRARARRRRQAGRLLERPGQALRHGRAHVRARHRADAPRGRVRRGHQGLQAGRASSFTDGRPSHYARATGSRTTAARRSSARSQHVDGTFNVLERNTHARLAQGRRPPRTSAASSPTPAASPRASTCPPSTRCCS